MHILFVSADEIPHVGGKSTHILDLIDALESSGSQVKVVSLNSIVGYKRVILRALSIIYRVKPLNRISEYTKELSKYYLEKVILNICSKNQIDIISAQDVYAVKLCKRALKRRNIPVVLTMHTYFGIEPLLDKSNDVLKNIDSKEIIASELESLEYVDTIISVDSRISKHVENVIKEFYPLKDYHQSTIKNFTNIDRFISVTNDKKSELRVKYNIDCGKFVIVCSRRMVEKNGVAYAVKALKHISSKTNVLLLLVGDGPQRHDIEKAIEKYGVRSLIKILGSIDNKDIHEIYQLADASIVPSVTVKGLQEATSISALESMACGLPVIASDIGGLRELIYDGENGLLVDERSDIQIANAITKLVENKDICKYIGINARKFVAENHSHNKVSNVYMKEFTNAINRGRLDGTNI